MNSFTQKDIKVLFENLCCSNCRNDFSAESVTVKDKRKDILLCNLTCRMCGKNFGDVVFNFNQKSRTHTPLKVIDSPAPISSDDVIDAHRFIKKMK